MSDKIEWTKRDSPMAMLRWRIETVQRSLLTVASAANDKGTAFARVGNPEMAEWCRIIARQLRDEEQTLQQAIDGYSKGLHTAMQEQIGRTMRAAVEASDK